MVTETVAL